MPRRSVSPRQTIAYRRESPRASRDNALTSVTLHESDSPHETPATAAQMSGDNTPNVPHEFSVDRNAVRPISPMSEAICPTRAPMHPGSRTHRPTKEWRSHVSLRVPVLSPMPSPISSNDIPNTSSVQRIAPSVQNIFPIRSSENPIRSEQSAQLQRVAPGKPSLWKSRRFVENSAILLNWIPRVSRGY